jgi:hypothetical protein
MGNMLRALLLIALAWPAAAQSATADREQAARDVVTNAAQALLERHPAAFLEALDKPLAEKLRKPVDALLRSFDVQPVVEFVSATTDDRGVALAVDWKMDIAAREGLRSVTHRRRRLTCRIESRDGAPKIVTLDGVLNAPGLFSPPDIDGAWDLIESAARLLSQRDAPAAGFLSVFDSKSPSYESLRDGAESLAGRGEVDSTVALTTDDGTDTARTLEVDWTLEVVNPDTGIRVLQRESPVTAKMERRGKRWVIVSIAPLEFFTK